MLPGREPDREQAIRRHPTIETVGPRPCEAVDEGSALGTDLADRLTALTRAYRLRLRR